MISVADTVEYSRLKLDTIKHLDKKLHFENCDSIRTRRRALMFLSIALLQPVSRLALRKLGYTGKTIATFTKQSKAEGLITERGFLFSLTEEGVEILKEITKEPFLASWYNHVTEEDQHRAHVHKGTIAGS